jgi:hypothetical protein
MKKIIVLAALALAVAGGTAARRFCPFRAVPTLWG